uniref:Uncharacterized protein n=1 Tax=Fervidobacterium pennivorans TaxID=93466 RepID=A0A7V4NGH7_FERPE
MDIRKVVKDAWSKTIEDFEEAKRIGEAWLWTEDTLRLYFFHHFCKQDIKIVRILAETSFHLGNEDYKPDLVIDIFANDAIKTVVFEFKYFSDTMKWKSDWEKLQRYGIIGWNYGFFLAIGRPSQCDEIPKGTQRLEFLGHTYETMALTHSSSSLKTAPDFKIAEGLLKKSLIDIPYIVSELLGAVAFLENILIYFDMTVKQDRCVVWASLDKELWDEPKLREMGYDKWISFDDEGRIQPAETFTGNVLICEVEANTYNHNIKKVKDSLDQFLGKVKTLLSKQV